MGTFLCQFCVLSTHIHELSLFHCFWDVYGFAKRYLGDIMLALQESRIDAC